MGPHVVYIYFIPIIILSFAANQHLASQDHLKPITRAFISEI